MDTQQNKAKLKTKS